MLADHDGDGLSDGLQARLAETLPGEPVDVVVSFSGPSDVEAAQRAVGPFQLKRQFRIIDGFAATMTAAQARGLAKASGVFRVEEDFPVSALLDASRRDFGIQAVDQLSLGIDGTGIGICVVDTGVDPRHEQLDAGKVVGFVDFVNGQTAAYDDHGHGTHVAAIAAGDGNPNATFRGVAPGASVYSAKVLNSAGSGSDSDVISGVEWCVDQPGVHIISLSLGSVGSSDGRDSLSQAINNAVAAGKTAVIAAGNSGAGPATVGSPGAAEQAITVGAAAEWSADVAAANHSDGVFLAWFSSRGPTADGRIKPDIVSPGVSVTSAQAGTTNRYVTWSGTSMATPFVSGTVALALSLNNSLTPAQVKTILKNTAQDWGPAGLDNDSGAGLLNGYAFVEQAGGMSPDPAAFAFPTHERQTGIVPAGGVKEFFFEIGEQDLNVPVAAAITVTSGGKICLYGSPMFCDLLGGWAWSPDYDAELIQVGTNTTVDTSICPLTGECGTLGRQETLHFMPTQAKDVGTYKVRVYQYPDDPGGIQEGSVALDISTGPVAAAGGGAPNQPPTADAGPDQSVTDSDGNGSQSVTLNGSGSSDPDGTISSYLWKEGATQIATGATPSVTLAVGTHTIALTVTDNDGAADTDTVVVTVNADGGSGGGNPVTITSRVNSGNDDVEEYETGGTMYLDSSDLELVADGSKGNQHVGMRFNNLNVPQGATITNAYIQFTVDEASTGAANLTIKGQAADNAATFSSTTYDVTSRPATSASVAWNPVDWNAVGAAGVDQQTPDLKGIIQEIVNRSGWAQNNSMVIIVEGTGKRTAESYNGSASQAPQLVITYTTGGSSNQPPVADAGPDQSLSDSDGNGSETVTLDGSASSDPDGTISSYVWKEGATQIATGAAPAVTLSVGIHTLTLIVTDNDGAAGNDTVVVTVNAAPNQPPTADAGPDQSVTDSDGNGSQSVTLNGSGSSDPDGTISSYLWKEGATQIATGATPSVTLAVGTHTIALTVTDNDGAADTDTVVVTVNAGGPATLTLHVGDLDAESLAIKSDWQSIVTITVHDAAHSPVSGARISGSWSGGYSGSSTCTTTDGKCTVTSGKARKKNGIMIFTVDGLSLGGYTYDTNDNHDPDGDSNGTSITVSKP